MADYQSLFESIECTYHNTPKPIYIENHIYKRRNRRASLAKRKGKGRAYVREVLRDMY